MLSQPFGVAVLVMCRDVVEEGHFRVPTFIPVLAIASCLVMAGSTRLGNLDAGGCTDHRKMLLNGCSRLNLSAMSKAT